MDKNTHPNYHGKYRSGRRTRSGASRLQTAVSGCGSGEGSDGVRRARLAWGRHWGWVGGGRQDVLAELAEVVAGRRVAAHDEDAVGNGEACAAGSEGAAECERGLPHHLDTDF